MNSNTVIRATDWDNIPESKLTSLQAIAKKSKGIVTISNFLSVSGLLIVLFGLVQIYNSNWALGLIAIALGRSFDLLDGYVASKTNTKSWLGEAFDTISDKIGIFAFLITASLMSVFSAVLILTLAFHHSYIAIYGIVFGRKHNLHPKKIGKFAMFFSWVAIIASIASASTDMFLLNFVTYIATTCYVVLAICAVAAYHKDYKDIKKLS